MIAPCSVVGLGKLGACMSACIAHKGIPVVGVDVSPHAIGAINAGLPPVYEPRLAEMIAANRARLRATSDYREAIATSRVTFIVVPTPSEEDGGFSLRYVAAAAEAIGRALREKDDYHLVVLTSTVLPGSSQFAVKPILEAESGRTCGQDFGLCYSPEFIALGSVIRDFLNPDFILIGESDHYSGDLLSDLYAKICDNDPPIARMSMVNAELTKIAVNTFVTMKITFANTLARLCEQLPGADVDVVTSALGLDSRIGQRYLKGGLGYGGPCFPRDSLALSALARQIGQRVLLAEATDQANRELAVGIVDRVIQRVTPDAVVAVLGLSYKPQSNVVEESQALYLAHRLAEHGADVVVYDPVATENARVVLGDRVRYAPTVSEALEEAAVVVVANPDQAFAWLQAGDFPVRPLVVFDCWRMLRRELEGVPGIDYVPLGVGGDGAAALRQLAGKENGMAVG